MPLIIDSPVTAAEALRDYFLANAEAGNNAANDELVAELVRRIRTQQAAHKAVPHSTRVASQHQG